MKIVTYLALITVGILATVSPAASQSTNKTIVLVRHAEKDVSPTADKGDPILTAEGRERAIRLMNAVKRYKPHEIFSTDFKRTRDTAAPIAAKRKKQIQIYDSTKPADLVAKILMSNTDHYLIVGHSNTIPRLVNLLAKKEVFRDLLDGEHSVIYVVRMKNGVLTKIEIFTY